MGFFLHIPFPPPEMIEAIPVHNWLMEVLFQFDVVGFQTTDRLGNFRRLSRDILAVRFTETVGKAYGRTIIARDFPIGIDVEEFAALARTPAASAQIERLNRRTVVRSHIIGVDRLDYTKGLPERLKAFRKLLELYPEHQKTVTLTQIAPPRGLRSRRMSISGPNLRYSLVPSMASSDDFDWTPVRYVHRSVSQDILAALFQRQRSRLVTPLRDGDEFSGEGIYRGAE